MIKQFSRTSIAHEARACIDHDLPLEIHPSHTSGYADGRTPPSASPSLPLVLPDGGCGAGPSDSFDPMMPHNALQERKLKLSVEPLDQLEEEKEVSRSPKLPPFVSPSLETRNVGKPSRRRCSGSKDPKPPQNWVNEASSAPNATPARISFLSSEQHRVLCMVMASALMIVLLLIAVVLGLFSPNDKSTRLNPTTCFVVAILAVTLMVLMLGYVMHRRGGNKAFANGAVAFILFWLVPLTLFIASLVQRESAIQSWHTHHNSMLDVLVVWMAAAPWFVLSLGKLRLCRLAFFSSLVVVFTANILTLALGSKERTGAAWFGEIVLLIYRLVPMAIIYLSVTSNVYREHCGRIVIQMQIAECRLIADRIAHMDFDFLKAYESSLVAAKTESANGPNELQQFLFTIVEGLREYRSFLPSTIFHHHQTINSSLSNDSGNSTAGKAIFKEDTTLQHNPSVMSGSQKDCAAVTTSNHLVNLAPLSLSESGMQLYRPPLPGKAPSQPLSPPWEMLNKSKPSSFSFSYRRSQKSPVKLHAVAGPMSPGFSTSTPLHSPQLQTYNRMPLANRMITMAVIHLRGFYESESDLDVQAIQQINEAFIEIVDKAVKINKGTLHSFECGLAIAHWNAHVPMAGHTRSACAAVWEIHRKIQPKISEWRKEGHLGISIHIGVANGPMICGHTGTAEARRFNLFGPLWPLCHMLSKASASLGSSILVTETIYEDSKFHFRFRSAASVSYTNVLGSLLISERAESGTLSSPGGFDSFKAYELTGSLSTSSSSVQEEWMYVVERSEKANPYAEYEAGFGIMMNPDGDLNQAVIHFSRFQEQHPGYDRLCRTLVRLCTLGVKSSTSPFPLIWKEELNFHDGNFASFISAGTVHVRPMKTSFGFSPSLKESRNTDTNASGSGTGHSVGQSGNFRPGWPASASVTSVTTNESPTQYENYPSMGSPSPSQSVSRQTIPPQPQEGLISNPPSTSSMGAVDGFVSLEPRPISSASI